MKGKNWVALNGCCGIRLPAPRVARPTSGQLNNSQRFAIDWKQMNAAGEFFTGRRTTNESYVDYGSKIYAVADGTVADARRGRSQHARDPPGADPELAPKITVENVDGNHIVIDIGGGEFAMYAHLIKGSLKVKQGDKVKKGDVIAELGNTGNSNASHMHFQLMDGPSILTPPPALRVDRFIYGGQVDPQQIIDTDDYFSGQFLEASRPRASRARRSCRSSSRSSTSPDAFAAQCAGRHVIAYTRRRDPHHGGHGAATVRGRTPSGACQRACRSREQGVDGYGGGLDRNQLVDYELRELRSGATPQ